MLVIGDVLSTTTEFSWMVFNTDRFSGNDYEYDCIEYDVSTNLYLYKIEGRQVSQRIRYCIRPSYRLDDNPSQIEIDRKYYHIESIMTFKELHMKRNITAEQVVTSSGYTSIDVIERYKIYLETFDESLSHETIHRCRNKWFGSQCQYTLSSNTKIEKTLNLRDYPSVDDLYDIRSSSRFVAQMTCYTHLICNRGPPPACLDWREICDGTIDCANDDGIDERFCDQLKTFECLPNEFRCVNGRQCIPNEFYNDDPLNPDCQDGSDEIIPIEMKLGGSYTYPNECDRDPAMRCEERTCPSNELACGDGQCVEYYHQCYNNRGRLLFVQYAIYSDRYRVGSCRSLPFKCDTHITDFKGCRPSCWSSDIALCEHELGQICASIIFKQSPSIFRPNNEMYIFYNSNDIPPKRSWILVPHDHCFTDIHCNNTQIRDDNPTFAWCLSQRKSYNLTYVGTYSRTDLTATIQHLNRGCSRVLSNSNQQIFDKTNVNQSITVNNSEFSILKICDGIQHLNMIIIDNMNITDESECEYWPCNNVYTRCDGIVNCRDGSDEFNCQLLRCADDEMLCVSIDGKSLICLPSSKIGDMEVDCIGGSDEPDICKEYEDTIGQSFRCARDYTCITADSVCDGFNDCLSMEDEFVCTSFWGNLLMSLLFCVYSPSFLYIHSSFSKCFRHYVDVITFSSLMNIESYPLTNSKQSNEEIIVQSSRSISSSTKTTTKITKSSNENVELNCHRGLEAYHLISSEKDTFERKCFCPPSYYGNQCQYQTDRVSLTLRFRLSLSQRNNFIFSITLRDEQQHEINSFIIHRYQSSEECDIKFSSYLLYSTPMKNRTKDYLIHIDIYKHDNLVYYGSWYSPIRHSFLPVSRIAALVHLPIEPMLSLKKNQCPLECQHGQCMKYSNIDKYFCHCDSHWRGLLCDIKEHFCDCSHDSLCLGSANYRPICLCPYYKGGPRCLLNSTCRMNVCNNGGTCIPQDNHYRCICTDEFEGFNCEQRKSIVSLEFLGIKTHTYVIVHILSKFTIGTHQQNVTFQKLRININTVDIYISSEIGINLIFVEFPRTYYLAVVQNDDARSLKISSIVSSDRRCFHVRELVDPTIANSHPLRRIKHYPRLCQQRKDLVCFYDGSLMCICTRDRFSNCFKFNSESNTSCLYENPCEKNGQCFQDRPNCPSIVQCICSDCYYGTRCQFSTIGLGVSLDAMLGYAIQPDKTFSEQYSSVKISAILTSCLFVIGLISNILSLMTFERRQCRVVGCGIYLLALSLTSLLAMIIFMMKFWFLFLIQTDVITDGNLVYVNCLLIEICMHVCLSTSNWLSACVAVERTVSVIMPLRFNQIKSKQISIRIIFLVLCFVILTYLPDPLHRVLIKDEIENRRWCIVRSSIFIENFNSINLLVHNVAPFLINGISAIVLIIGKSHTYSTTNNKQSYFQYLFKYLRDFKHLLISPVVLVLLSVPRLILAFLPGCMKSNEDLWIYLVSYFVSFIPPLLTFPIFVLPFRLYRNEFATQTKVLFRVMTHFHR